DDHAAWLQPVEALHLRDRPGDGADLRAFMRDVVEPHGLTTVGGAVEVGVERAVVHAVVHAPRIVPGQRGPAQPRMIPRISVTSSSTSARVGASTLRRRSGSVLEARTLNHAGVSFSSTVTPSRRSTLSMRSAKASSTACVLAAWSSTVELISPEAS